MKKLYALAAVLLMAAMLASIGLASAQEMWFPYLIVPERTKGIIWYFATDLDGDGVNEFSGRDVKKCTVVCEWWDDDGNGGVLDPLLILTTKNYVMLVFWPWDLPELATNTQVTGELKNGDTFLASGPGFTYRPS